MRFFLTGTTIFSVAVAEVRRTLNTKIKGVSVIGFEEPGQLSLLAHGKACPMTDTA